MSARAARRRRQSEVAANRHRQSKPPSREHLQRENDRLRRENEELRREVVRREKQIADAEEQIADAEKQIADAEKQIADAEKQIADAEKQIADLERQLALRKRNSTNSSKPPSSDGLAGEQRPRGRKHKGKRKPGGQPGHTGHHRPLLPTAEVNAVEERLPKQCEHCGGKLPQKPGQVTTEGAPRRHQVTEVPPVKAHVTEYQFPNVVCGRCGKTTRASLPKQIRGELWTAVDRADRLLDRGLPPAPAAGGSHAGRCAGHRDQSGKHPEGLGRSQSSGRPTGSAIAGAVAAGSGAERR